MMSSYRLTGPVVAMQRPDEDVPSIVTALEQHGSTLHQQTLFQYGEVPLAHQIIEGIAKRASEYAAPSLRDSLPWGNVQISGTEVEEQGVFHLLSHNVNGLSAADDQADVLHFATAIKDKSVALFGLQETNHNFEH